MRLHADLAACLLSEGFGDLQHLQQVSVSTGELRERVMQEGGEVRAPLLTCITAENVLWF